MKPITKNNYRRRALKHLVWIDCEMGGLELTDTLLQVGVVITDVQLKPVDSIDVVIGHSQEELANMNSWCVLVHTNNGLVKRCLASTETFASGQDKIVEFMKPYLVDCSSPWCGNCVWNDRSVYRQIHAQN